MYLSALGDWLWTTQTPAQQQNQAARDAEQALQTSEYNSCARSGGFYTRELNPRTLRYEGTCTWPTQPAAPAPAPANITVNTATQVSPQISPNFIQQDEPQNSPVNASTQAGAPDYTEVFKQLAAQQAAAQAALQDQMAQQQAAALQAAQQAELTRQQQQAAAQAALELQLQEAQEAAQRQQQELLDSLYGTDDEADDEPQSSGDTVTYIPAPSNVSVTPQEPQEPQESSFKQYGIYIGGAALVFALAMLANKDK